MAGIFLTRAPSRSAIVKFFGIDIPAGNTVVVDSIPFVDNVAAKWLVTVIDDTNVRKQSYEVRGHYLVGTPDPYYTTYALIGDRPIHNRAEVVVSGSNLELEITNLGTVDLVVNVLRFDLVA
jgi:hypothetical protein